MNQEPHVSPTVERILEPITAFGNNDSVAMLATGNIERARHFYENTLGIKVTKRGEILECHTGASRFYIYESEFAGTNKANALCWSINDKFEELIASLKVRGIHFEHYQNLPETELKGDVHYAHKMKLVWFKDPDGNILHLINESKNEKALN